MTFDDRGVVTMIKKGRYNTFLDIDEIELALIDFLESNGLFPLEVEVSEVKTIKKHSHSFDIVVEFNAEVDSNPKRVRGSAFIRYDEEEASFEGVKISYNS
jgi:hypothetical protein